MPDFMITALVLIVLGVVVVLAARSMYKSRKSGGSCTGDCSSCGGACHKH